MMKYSYFKLEVDTLESDYQVDTARVILSGVCPAYNPSAFAPNT